MSHDAGSAPPFANPGSPAGRQAGAAVGEPSWVAELGQVSGWEFNRAALSHSLVLSHSTGRPRS